MHQQITYKIKKILFSTHQELLASFGVVLLCLFASLLFPARNSAQIITKSLFFMLLLPVAYVKLILGKNLADFGWNLKNKKMALGWGAGLALLTLIILYLLIHYTKFGSGYVVATYLKNSFWLFSFHELLITNLSLFIFCYFFQGFTLSLFQKTLGLWAIALQTGIFFVALFLADSLSWQTMPLILLSITGGFLAWKTKSFFYSYFMSFFAIIILDTYIIYLTK